MIRKTERKWLYAPLPVGPIGQALLAAQNEKTAKDAERNLLGAILDTRANFVIGKDGF